MKRGTLGFPPVSPWLLLAAIAAKIEIMSGIPGYDAALSAAILTVPASPAVRQPWETNKVMRMIFGGPDEVAIKRPRLNLAGQSFSSASAVSNDTAQTLHLAKTVPRVRPTTQHLKTTSGWRPHAEPSQGRPYCERGCERREQPLWGG